MVFSMNQTMQVYVNNGAASAVVKKSDKDGCVKFVIEDAGTTDIIDPKKVMWVTKTTSAELQAKVPVATVTISNVIEGDYILRMTFRGVHGLSDGDQYIKYGTARANASTTTAQLAEMLTESLNRNARRDVEPLYSAKAANGVITITVKASEWKLGLFTGRIPQLDENSFVFIGPDEDAQWATVVMSTAAADSSVIPVSAKLADLEYFALGNRGDQYRNVGWPNVVHSDYKVDPTSAYTCYTIHYYANSSNEAVQKSEKEIIIISKADCPDVEALDPNSSTETE